MDILNPIERIKQELVNKFTRLEEVTENFICVIEDKKNLNKAIEFNKQFFNR